MIHIIQIGSNLKVIFSDESKLVIEIKKFDLEIAEMRKPLSSQRGFYVLNDKQLKQKRALNAKKLGGTERLLGMRQTVLDYAEHWGVDFAVALNEVMDTDARFIGEFEQNQIAVIMGITKQAVDTIEKKAIAKLSNPKFGGLGLKNLLIG